LKVLFATDLSVTALVVRDLLAGLTWPGGAQLELLHVVPPRGSKPFAGMLGSWESTPASAEKAVTAFTRELRAQLAGRAVSVSTSIRVGDPASSIVERADEIKADLVVLGSRGRGPLLSSVLGTVSAAVVERASRSVLVARTKSIRSLVLVDDGTTSSHAAVEAIFGQSLFDAVHVTVVRVVDLQTPLGEGLYQDRSMFEHRDRLRASRTRRAAAAVEKRVAGLRASGRMAMGRVLKGDTATEVLSAARGVGADLIVIGAHGRNQQLEGHLGDVVRNVLLSFRGSVLIVRPPTARNVRADSDSHPASARHRSTRDGPEAKQPSTQRLVRESRFATRVAG
jgi:nucleotide-binding universal stress UspA family protein